MSARLRVLLVASAAALLLVGGLLWACERRLQAHDGDWAVSVRLGPFERHWQAAKLARLATLPGIARVLEGRSMSSVYGTWTVRRSRGAVLFAECIPCVIHAQAFGGAPLRFNRLAIALTAARGGAYAGRIWIGRDQHALASSWHAQPGSQGLSLEASADALPIASLLEAVQPRLPELDRASITGTLGFRLQYGGDSGTRLLVEPRVTGLHVSGLGTERLINAALPEQCGPVTSPLRGWLPIAVVAAEDQTFHSHPGFELQAVRAALLANIAGTQATAFGASTLSQQLAKLVYTGDSREPVRKLRELLYAVEMEETLGKARILQTYLAIAPWGPGVCGAERAAQRYLGKSAALLDPLEAAWLAGLLRNPGAALRQLMAGCGIDEQRTAWVLEQMRPMALWRRNYWLGRLHTLRPSAQGSTATEGCLRQPTTRQGFPETNA